MTIPKKQPIPLEQYREFFRNAPVGFAICDRVTGQYEEVNAAFIEMLGLKEESEVLARDYWEITPRKYERQETEQLVSLDNDEKYGPYEKEYIYQRKNEGDPDYYVPVRMSGVLMVGADGRKMIWSVVEDLSKNKNRVMFQEARIGLVLCDKNGTLIDVNREFAGYLGYSIQELEYNMNYWMLTPQKYREEELNIINNLTPEKNLYGVYNKDLIHKNGELVPVMLWGLLLPIDGIEYIWSIVQQGRFGGDVGGSPTTRPITEPPSEEEIQASLRPLIQPAKKGPADAKGVFGSTPERDPPTAVNERPEGSADRAGGDETSRSPDSAG
jgi:PAS domain S-box-containing protein